MHLSGKGFFIWKIPDCEGGDIQKIAWTAHSAGLSHVIIKIANGIYDYNYDPTTLRDLVGPLANELAKYDIQTLGWHYVFGDFPLEEARAAIRQINHLPISGYVIDAEAHYKGKQDAARIFMDELRKNFPDFPVALSSYRFPEYHMELPWKEFLSRCELNMPQVYWEQAHNPGEQLERSINTFKTMISPFRPIFPTGAAYGTNGWEASATEILEFMNQALSLGLPGVNFWSWDYCRKELPALWDVIASFNWPNGPGNQKDTSEKIIDCYNSRDINALLLLYQPDAVHINANRTIQGHSSLREWFELVFFPKFKDAAFHVVDISGEEQSRQFNWIAEFRDQSQINGTDTIGISAGKIIYHYSSWND